MITKMAMITVILTRTYTSKKVTRIRSHSELKQIMATLIVCLNQMTATGTRMIIKNTVIPLPIKNTAILMLKKTMLIKTTAILMLKKTMPIKTTATHMAITTTGIRLTSRWDLSKSLANKFASSKLTQSFKSNCKRAARHSISYYLL